jgi:hypothetical protein
VSGWFQALNSRKGEAGLSENTYTAKQEKQVLAALGRGLQNEFPNPERVGCPGREIITAVADHRMPLSKAEPYLDHLSSCSPCYRDFLQLQTEHRRRRARVTFAVAASVLIVLGLATWAILRPHGQQVANAVIDLRDRSMARGTEPPASEPPVEIPRGVSHLQIYLPLGSSEGSYDVQINSVRNEPFFSGTGEARLRQGLTVLGVDLGRSSPRSGNYILHIRKPTSEWVSFALHVR